MLAVAEAELALIHIPDINRNEAVLSMLLAATVEPNSESIPRCLREGRERVFMVMSFTVYISKMF